MADYYPLIAKALSGLAPDAPGESRRGLYERARAALIAQLRSVQPALSESEINRERLSLEEAVRKVEREAAQLARMRSRSSGDLIAYLGTIIPEQNLKQAIGFSPTRRGPLDLVLDPPSDPFDPEQTILYQRIRLQLKQLKDTIPSQERTQIDPAIDEFLDQPENWHEVEFKKILWLCGNSIRTLLTQHDAVKSDAEPHYSKLPPSVAEALRRPIQAWNVFVQGDQDLAQLDAQRLGPQEQVEILKHLAAAAQLIAKAATDRNITTERAAHALTSTLKAANDSNSNINTRLAQDLADKTSQNFFSQILRRAYLIRNAIIDPDSEAAKTLALEFVKGASSAAGGATLLFLGSHAISFFEFVAMNPTLVKEYILVAFQNIQMTEIVDAIEFEYRRLKMLGGNDHKV
jgi:hypothetical protein